MVVGVSVGESGTVSEYPGRVVTVSECPGRLVTVGRVMMDSSGPGAVKVAVVQATMEANATSVYILVGMVRGTEFLAVDEWLMLGYRLISSNWNNGGLLDGGCNYRSPAVNI